jgi:hypothetical protein
MGRNPIAEQDYEHTQTHRALKPSSDLLIPSPNNISLELPSISLTSTSRQGKSGKRGGWKGCLCFALKTWEMMKKSIKALFEDGSPPGAVRGVGDDWGRVYQLPNPQLQKHLC